MSETRDPKYRCGGEFVTCVFPVFRLFSPAKCDAAHGVSGWFCAQSVRSVPIEHIRLWTTNGARPPRVGHDLESRARMVKWSAADS